jgi:hypothetical protein
MANYHFEINSGKKGSALEHAKYITRQGKYRDHEDLVAVEHGNLPAWTGDDPMQFWKMANKYERANGSVFREYEISFSNEMNSEQWKELARRFVRRMVGPKAYHLAIHAPDAALAGVCNPHMHLMFSDRLPDGIERSPDRTFARYNASRPDRGGRKKDSGGKGRLELRDDARAKRKLIADIQNEMLAEIGVAARVDHRSYKERGIEGKPERHLGPARIKHMSEQEKTEYLAGRSAGKNQRRKWPT